MDVRNCKKCGRIYNYVLGPNLCPLCMKELESTFQEVKKYIYEHPGVGVAEVSEAMDVSVAQIRQWVREERLQFAEGSVTDIQCEKCGKTIFSGRFCPQCKEAMARDFGGVYNSAKKNMSDDEKTKKAKMRYL